MLKHLLYSLVFLIAVQVSVPATYAQAGSEEATFEDVKKESRDLIQALKGYGAEQRDEAVGKAKEALDNLDRRVDALESKVDNRWDQMDKAARDQARARLNALRKQRTELAEWYGGWKQSSASAWGYMKKGFSDAYQTFSDAWEKAENEFGAAE